MAVAIRKLAILATIMILALAACRDERSGNDEGSNSAQVTTCPSREGTTSLQGETPDEFDDLVKRMAAALTCPGHVAHIAAKAEITFSDLKFVEDFQYWIDVEQNIGRSEEGPTVSIEPLTEDARRALESHRDELDAPRETNVNIISTEGRYVSASDGMADRVAMPDCLDAELAALGVLIDCIDIGFDSKVTVESSFTYEGEDIIAVVAKDGDPNAGDEYWSTYTFYVDPESLTPVASSSEMVSPATLDDPTPVEGSALFEYAVDFVPADSLPADFFHPDSIGGYEEPDPLATAYAIDAPVYWLGEEFPGDGTYPPVTLVHAFPAPPELADIFPAIMTYRPSGDAPEFDITVETYPSMEAGGEHGPPASACLHTRSVDIPGRQAKIYSLPPITPGPMDDEAPCRPPGMFFADVTIDGVAVKVTTFTIGSHNPYNSEAGMELLIRSLELRE